MKSILKRFTAITLAVLTVMFTFCFTSFAFDGTKGAELTVNGTTCHYDSISEAWSVLASENREATLKLNEDWTADENGSFGEGDGFSNGAIFLKNKSKKITLDLNGHTVDRGLTKAVYYGYVFLIRSCSNVLITDTSAEKTGTITGGKNKGSAGAIGAYGSRIKLENITIKNNVSTSRGGAFHIDIDRTNPDTTNCVVTIDNCTLTENKASTGGAIYIETLNSLKIYDSVITKNEANSDAGIHTEVLVLDVSYITLGGKVIIADNIAENDGTGLMLDESFFRKVYVKYDKNRPLSKESKITVLSKTDDNTLRITDDSSDHYFECYEYENDSYKIVKKGSGNDKYLGIKKN